MWVFSWFSLFCAAIEDNFYGEFSVFWLVVPFLNVLLLKPLCSILLLIICFFLRNNRYVGEGDIFLIGLSFLLLRISSRGLILTFLFGFLNKSQSTDGKIPMVFPIIIGLYASF